MSITLIIIITLGVLLLASLIANKQVRDTIVKRAKLVGKSKGSDEGRTITVKKAEKQIVKNEQQIIKNTEAIKVNNDLIIKAKDLIKKNKEVIENAKKTVN